MSAAELPSLPDFEAAARTNTTNVIWMMMKARGVETRKALAALLANYGISQSTVYSRLAMATDWQASEIRALGAVLDCTPMVFFAEPVVEEVAPLIDMEPQEMINRLISRGQNWKKLTTSDLHVVHGGQDERKSQVTATRGEQLRLRHLAVVPT